MRSRGTHACTTAEIAKPNTSAHHTSQAIRKASSSPSPIVVRTLMQRGSCPSHSPGSAGPADRAWWVLIARRGAERPAQLFVLLGGDLAASQTPIENLTGCTG